ncbi:hypothetical protein DSCO28_24820 [Desulfosarcina ovata subsp. sediminis]|uniref:Uncharacterized protein n=1 Tax=Desulfosarcina ovata subsp. sediminis TaxID=885957 RepID=A0A5K7ZLG7_9BACT|nr:hypothetical protein DSCO28_24820 [Desulfosarcina ovata subsp. sediminis]
MTVPSIRICEKRESFMAFVFCPLALDVPDVLSHQWFRFNHYFAKSNHVPRSTLRYWVAHN